MSFSTPDLCDDFPELVRVVEPMFINFGGTATVCGEIFTVKCFEDKSLVKENASKPGYGKVMVVDGGGSLRRALLGDLIAKDAVKNGWEGFIIYGCIRDVDIINRLDVGVHALDTVPLKTEKKGIGELNIAVTFGGVTFRPGEYVYADNNGVIVSKEKLLTTD